MGDIDATLLFSLKMAFQDDPTPISVDRMAAICREAGVHVTDDEMLAHLRWLEEQGFLASYTTEGDFAVTSFRGASHPPDKLRIVLPKRKAKKPKPKLVRTVFLTAAETAARFAEIRAKSQRKRQRRKRLPALSAKP